MNNNLSDAQSAQEIMLTFLHETEHLKAAARIVELDVEFEQPNVFDVGINFDFLNPPPNQKLA